MKARFWRKFERLANQIKALQRRFDPMVAEARGRISQLVDEQKQIDAMYDNLSKLGSKSARRGRRPNENSAARILKKLRESEGEGQPAPKKADRVSATARARMTAGLRRYHAKRRRAAKATKAGHRRLGKRKK